MTTVYYRTVLTEDTPPTPEISARLHPFQHPTAVEVWEPGRIFVTLPSYAELSENRMYRYDIVFGVSDGENVFMTGYLLHDGQKKNVTQLRGSGMEVNVGVPTDSGVKPAHFFALFGTDMLTDTMRASTKKMVRLTHPQVLHLFRNQPPHAFRYLANAHAHRSAMASLRRVRSRSRRSRTKRY